ncbi:MAG: methylmalonyl Co-A mutase-associated GTPase MeaB [candidate division WOR-3 bacterium]
MNLIKELSRGNKIALARAISKVENQEDGYEELLKETYLHTGNAYYLGITGPPGAGKSTLVDCLARRLAGKNKRVGIIAVDPTSPFSGGALLGDRIRMSSLATNPSIFIRSMASRGSLGGIARATKDVAVLMDAFGMNYIIIETIGVGQVEIDIADACDSTVLVLVPESGDAIQVMKAGLIEIADIIVVNKADREGAEKLVRELKTISELREKKNLWEYPVLMTEALYEKGLDQLVDAIFQHEQFLKKSGEFLKHRKERLKRQICNLIEERIWSCMKSKFLESNALDLMVDRIFKKELSPIEAVDRIMMSKEIFNQGVKKRWKR